MLLLFIELLLCISQDSGPLREHSSSPPLSVSTAAIFLLIITSLAPTFPTTILFFYFPLLSFSVTVFLVFLLSGRSCAVYFPRLLVLSLPPLLPLLLLPRSLLPQLSSPSFLSPSRCFIIQASASERAL